jgi:uncharacterized membrane protein
MMKTVATSISSTLVLGAATGLRTFMAPTMLSRAASGGRLPGIENTRFSPLTSSWVANLLAVAALGELVLDKLPLAPSRTGGGALLGRLISGALAGAAFRAAAGGNVRAGAALAGVGVVAAAYAGERYRASGAEAGIPDPVLAVLEDATAVGLALLAVRGS